MKRKGWERNNDDKKIASSCGGLILIHASIETYHGEVHCRGAQAAEYYRPAAELLRRRN